MESKLLNYLTAYFIIGKFARGNYFHEYYSGILMAIERKIPILPAETGIREIIDQ